MNKPRLAVTVLLLLPFAGSACAPAAGDDASIAEAVVGGTFEPNAQFPWEVSLNGCHGVLIDPQWVLTAAHCVTEGVWGGHVSYSRTDPYTGTVHADSRTVSPGYGAVYINEGYVPGGGFDSPIDDIALVRLPSPFTIDPYIQTVAIPGTPRVIGTTGAIAGGSHNGTPPPGYDAVMRTTIPSTNPSTCAPPAGAFCISSTTASLCPGDSGSGFVTVENGRAVVRGIASFMNSASSCQSIGPYDYAALTDVYSFHDWILATMRLSDATLAGNTRVHAAGRTARGVVGLGCTNPYGTMYAPTNVVGTEVGAECEPGDTESVVCSISPGQTAGILAQPIVVTGLMMKTTTSAGLVTTTALPVSSTFASYYGFLPAGVTREFTCQIGLGRLTTNGGALAR